jgi:hypothetical protein
MLFGIDFHHNFSPRDKSRALAPHVVRRESEPLIARSSPAAVELCEMSAASTLAVHLAHKLGCGPHCGWYTHCRGPHSGRVASGISLDCMGTPLYLWLGPEGATAAGTNTHSLPALSARVLIDGVSAPSDQSKKTRWADVILHQQIGAGRLVLHQTRGARGDS